jgi:quinolinate synthase
MFRIDLPHLCWVLENLVQGQVVNEIRVDPQTRKWAALSLDRMLQIAGSTAQSVAATSITSASTLPD